MNISSVCSPPHVTTAGHYSPLSTTYSDPNESLNLTSNHRYYHFTIIYCCSVFSRRPAASRCSREMRKRTSTSGRERSRIAAPSTKRGPDPTTDSSSCGSQSSCGSRHFAPNAPCVLPNCVHRSCYRPSWLESAPISSTVYYGSCWRYSSSWRNRAWTQKRNPGRQLPRNHTSNLNIWKSFP